MLNNWESGYLPLCEFAIRNYALISNCGTSQQSGDSVMKFNLRGLNPKKKCGESITYDVWSWRPLWHLIVNNSLQLDDDDRYRGQEKAEFAISGEKHKAVLYSLKTILRNRSHGELLAAVDQAPYMIFNGMKRVIDSTEIDGVHLYKIDWENVIDLYRFCKANDGFAIW